MSVPSSVKRKVHTLISILNLQVIWCVYGINNMLIMDDEWCAAKLGRVNEYS